MHVLTGRCYDKEEQKRHLGCKTVSSFPEHDPFLDLYIQMMSDAWQSCPESYSYWNIQLNPVFAESFGQLLSDSYIWTDVDFDNAFSTFYFFSKLPFLWLSFLEEDAKRCCSLAYQSSIFVEVFMDLFFMEKNSFGIPQMKAMNQTIHDSKKMEKSEFSTVEYWWKI